MLTSASGQDEDDGRNDMDLLATELNAFANERARDKDDVDVLVSERTILSYLSDRIFRLPDDVFCEG